MQVYKPGDMDPYDAGHAVLMINKTRVDGFGQDDMINFSFSQDRQTYTQDPQGKGVVSKNRKTGGTITINLSQMSAARKMMTELLDSTDNHIEVDFRDDAVHIYSNNCFINKLPDYQAGNTAGNRAWTLTAVNMFQEAVGGSNY